MNNIKAQSATKRVSPGMLALLAALTLVSCALSVTALLLQSHSAPRVAYIRTGELLAGFAGLKEARSGLQRQTMAWKANVDTLASEFQTAVVNYRQRRDGLSDSERQDQEELLGRQNDHLLSYKEAIDQKVLDEENSMVESVLEQINTLVEDYGRRQGYDIVLGTTHAGSVMYGGAAFDITDEVLAAINRDYRGGLLQ